MHPAGATFGVDFRHFMGKLDDTKRRVAVGLFFGMLLLLGPLLVRDYGMGWDERADRLVGYMSLRYVARYFLGTYRWHPAPYEPQFGTPMHNIQVDDMTILTVFQWWSEAEWSDDFSVVGPLSIAEHAPK